MAEIWHTCTLHLSSITIFVGCIIYHMLTTPHTHTHTHTRTHTHTHTTNSSRTLPDRVPLSRGAIPYLSDPLLSPFRLRLRPWPNARLSQLHAAKLRTDRLAFSQAHSSFYTPHTLG